LSGTQAPGSPGRFSIKRSEIMLSSYRLGFAGTA
jgi:hypothetical protein